MTIEAKREQLKRYCEYRSNCEGCPLNKYDSSCFSTEEPSVINRNYQAIFGDEPDLQAILTAAPLETIAEDADTIIKIKSSKKIDNITIYFKED
jgi:hypothetical protein|nr:MAG TPA: hypothetical protein [Caudoviricetes sp.]